MGISQNLPRCGRISYTNDLPVYTAIDEGVVTFPGVMIANVPTRLNQALLDGELDISPISSAFYAEHADELVLLPGVCIGAQDKVHSICLISALAPNEIAGKKVAVTRESATGRMLLQLICHRFYGFDPVLVESDDPYGQHLADGSPCLLIGDKAIDAAEQAPAQSVHDLGELWYRHTGLGMVFAVWAARERYAQDGVAELRSISRALVDSLDWGLENITHVAARAQASNARAEGFYSEYYRALRFRFDRNAQMFLERFIQSAHESGLLDRAPDLRFFDEAALHV